jgi:hypothetical protein
MRLTLLIVFIISCGTTEQVPITEPIPKELAATLEELGSYEETTAFT